MAEASAARVVVCRVGGERFALPVSLVREVVATPPVVRLPGAPAAIRGVANVNGTLVTAVSGPDLLGAPAAAPAPWLVVLNLWQGRVGIEVDEVEDVGDSAGLAGLDLEGLIQPLLAEND